jgi:LPS sulfotransferase NodH
MEKRPNPITKALLERGILLPEIPVDLSSALRQADVLRPYVICMTGRCGSTWLATALAQIPFCGKPFEYLSEEGIAYYGKPDGSGSFVKFVASIIDDHKTGQTFGLKIDGMRLEWLSSVCDLAQSFPSSTTAWIDMRRLNLVKQAFSFARAKKTGVWHVQATDQNQEERTQKAQEKIEIPDRAIFKEIVSIIRSEKTMDRFYSSAGLVPLRIVYEELLDSKSTLMLRVLAHLFPKRSFTVEQVAVADGTKKVSSSKNDMDELRFIERNAKILNAVYQLRYDPSVDSDGVIAAVPHDMRSAV